MRYFLFVAILVSGVAEAKCFSMHVSSLANSKKLNSALVLANSSAKAGGCTLLLNINGKEIFGEATGSLCELKESESAKVKVNTYCCDTGNCKTTPSKKIWFTAK